MVAVSDIMSRPVVTILPTRTVLDAAKLMTEKNIESLVVAWGDEAVGIITEKDIVRRVVAREYPYSTLTMDVMSKPVITININASIDEVKRLMHKKGVKRLPVEEKGLIVGIITESDL